MEESREELEEPFSLEDLLDFSQEEEAVLAAAEEIVVSAHSGESSAGLDSSSNSCEGTGENHVSGLANPPLGGEIPDEEIAHLEWLSKFVEESFSSDDIHQLQAISDSVKLEPISNNVDTLPDQNIDADQSSCVKARSKRARVVPCDWTSRVFKSKIEKNTSASSPESELINPPPPKIAKRKENQTTSEGKNLAPSDGRKCLHCATDKTPQWRTGPKGPKTLCNACGVRYKSGRLVPEYRPATSPTFVPTQHSNSHRKVLEIRRKNEIEGTKHHQQQLHHHHQQLQHQLQQQLHHQQQQQQLQLQHQHLQHYGGEFLPQNHGSLYDTLEEEYLIDPDMSPKFGEFI